MPRVAVYNGFYIVHIDRMDSSSFVAVVDVLVCFRGFYCTMTDSKLSQCEKMCDGNASKTVTFKTTNDHRQDIVTLATIKFEQQRGTNSGSMKQHDQTLSV